MYDTCLKLHTYGDGVADSKPNSNGNRYSLGLGNAYCYSYGISGGMPERNCKQYCGRLGHGARRGDLLPLRSEWP